MELQFKISFIAFFAFFLHNTENIKKIQTEKISQITASNNYHFGGSVNFEFYSDSTYAFIHVKNQLNNNKQEKFEGSCFLKNDTLYFKPIKFSFNESKKAVIKNNFIEFVDGKSPLKIEITKNIFQKKAALDLTKHKDYTFFTFDPKFYGYYFDYKPNIIKAYDLNQKELTEVDQILKKCFSKNALLLKKINQYVKQCIVIINEKQEKEVLINCYCKDSWIEAEYKYSLIDMSDGGNCNISVRINLNKHNYSKLNIAGEA
ncbi:hypothetical protein ACFSJW_17330 [Flavobacterium artemisiae]|uniref:Uncharacterized protein n=1 Tax=Flavobacterium artemisiae TaxID=2126556 RepID=A0ABW4H8S5_9FLAO